MADLLVLWDVDYTLVSADGLGTRLYEVVFREMFGRELTAVAPKAGRTDRAIVGDTLALSGVSPAYLDAFLAALARVAADGAVPGPVQPMAGAAAAVAALASLGGLASFGGRFGGWLRSVGRLLRCAGFFRCAWPPPGSASPCSPATSGRWRR